MSGEFTSGYAQEEKDKPPCHVCGAIMVPKKMVELVVEQWICLSCENTRNTA